MGDRENVLIKRKEGSMEKHRGKGERGTCSREVVDNDIQIWTKYLFYCLNNFSRAGPSLPHSK